MNKHMTAIVAAVCLMAAESPKSDDATKLEVAKLQGDWIAVSHELGGKVYVPKTDERKYVWHFAGDQLTRYEDSEKLDTVRWEVGPAETPKQLDLIPIEGEKPHEPGGILTLTKCIYSVENDKLIVATSFVFAPMRPEEEKALSRKLSGIRPKSFETKENEIMVVIFTRAKASAR